MQKRPFGRTGVDVPVMGQGTWRLNSHEDAAEALRVGVELGLTHIDTAELYERQSESESLLGELLDEWDRDDLFIASKVLAQNASFEGTKKACEGTLERLGVDRVDLYYLHWPSDRHPVRDTMRAMEELVDEGKIRFIGVSNFDVEELDDAMGALRKHELAANQVQYSLMAREPENGLIQHCRENGVAFVAYSPLGAGDFPSAKSAQGKALTEVAERHGATPHQVALNWVVRDEGTFTIPKAEHERHVRDNAKALDFELTREDRDVLDRAFPKPTAGRLSVL